MVGVVAVSAGLVVAPGVSQARAHARTAPLDYLSLGDSWSMGY